MPTLKCIGGYNDGECYDVKDLKVGDIFNIQEKVLTPVPPHRINASRKLETIKINQYKIHSLLIPEGFQIFSSILFLAPVDWTERQAVEWQFKK